MGPSVLSVPYKAEPEARKAALRGLIGALDVRRRPGRKLSLPRSCHTEGHSPNEMKGATARR